MSRPLVRTDRALSQYKGHRHLQPLLFTDTFAPVDGKRERDPAREAFLVARDCMLTISELKKKYQYRATARSSRLDCTNFQQLVWSVFVNRIWPFKTEPSSSNRGTALPQSFDEQHDVIRRVCAILANSAAVEEIDRYLGASILATESDRNTSVSAAGKESPHTSMLRSDETQNCLRDSKRRFCVALPQNLCS